MELGKTLVGAVIGAVVGIGILLAAYLLARQQGMWLAIPVALATGLGVRALVATKGHASIVRGAITLVLALLAYMGGWLVVAAVANSMAASTPSRPAAQAKADAAKDEPPGDATADAPADAAPPEQKAVVTRPRMAPSRGLPKATPGNNPLDFVWLGIAALIAYELGRGTGFAKPGGGPESADDVHDAPPSPDGIRTPD
jgi:hypothetical protein